MGCCSASVEDENRSEFTPKGPVKSRSCTDLICLLVFVAFLIGWGIIAAIAIIHGNPEQLFNPTDSEGNVCGVGKLADKKYLYYFDVSQCASPSVLISGCPTPQVCVSNCPSFAFFAADPSADLLKYKDRLICKYDVDLSKYNNNDQLRALVINGQCAPYYLPSASVVSRCVPSLANISGQEAIYDIAGKAIKNVDGSDLTKTMLKEANSLLNTLMSAQNVGEMVFVDFKQCWWMIIVGIVIAMSLSFLWIILIRFLGGIMVWFSLFGMLAVFGAGCGFSFYKYKQLEHVPGSDSEFILTTKVDYYLQLKNTWLAFGIIAAVFLTIVLLIVIFLRKRICIAIALINESSKAVAEVCSTLFFPMFPFILQLGFIAFWFFVAISISSMGNATYKATLKADAPAMCKDMYRFGDLACNVANFSNACGHCVFFAYETSGKQIWFQVTNVFGVLWVLFFIDGLSQMILAGAFSSWYWAFKKPKDIPACPLGASICRTITYHMGSVALGSLIIAIVRLIRIFLEFLDRKLKKYADNAVAKCILCCCKCFFWCLENFLKFVNKNAYIMVAIYGKSFCTSAGDAFALLLKNVARAVVLDKVTDFLLFIGKLAIVGGLGTFAFFFFSGQIPGSDKYVPQLNYYFVPVIVIIIGSYMVASAFFGVYEMAVDTIFLCFLEDCEINDGSQERPYFMSKKLMTILDKKNKKAKAE